MKTNPFYFSIDDGHPNDLIIAEWLIKYNIPAIFYIPAKNQDGKPTLSPQEIKHIAKHFEIGGHTFNHVDFNTIPTKKIKSEIESGKKYLEDIIAKPVVSFAPPHGNYNQKIIDLAYHAGFTSFRSARLINYHISNRTDKIWHPNLHLYPHSFLVDALSCCRYDDFFSLKYRVLHFNQNHIEQIHILHQLLSTIHVWGHSWEIKNLSLNLNKIFFFSK